MTEEQISLAKQEWSKGDRETKMAIERLFHDVDFVPNAYGLGEEFEVALFIEVTDIDKYSDYPYEVTATRIGDEEEPIWVVWLNAEQLDKLKIE